VTSRPTSAARRPRWPSSNGKTRQGRAAEDAVARFLEARGYTIIATNLRLSYLEVDVVARLGDVIAVVEVRSRSSSSWTSGFGSLDGRKRYRIRLAGLRLWQRRYRNDASVRRLRFDAASVVFGPKGPEIEYVEAAF
jgi:putative endonuclease